MNTYIIGETVIIRTIITSEQGLVVDPATSVKITVKDPAGATKVNLQTMTKEGVGQYTYDIDTAQWTVTGTYTVTVEAKDGARTSLSRCQFGME